MSEWSRAVPGVSVRCAHDVDVSARPGERHRQPPRVLPEAEAVAAIEAATARSLPVDAGSEETKSSDGAEGEVETAVATTKWHRELCSLAEMGFGDTPRNISLLEKHVTTSGGPGMER